VEEQGGVRRGREGFYLSSVYCNFKFSSVPVYSDIKGKCKFQAPIMHHLYDNFLVKSVRGL
jgi:hypothetical protein